MYICIVIVPYSRYVIVSVLVICDTPLFIRGHSKAILSKAIHNDIEFLSTNMVMDYSLLVGIDEVRMKLVVGIIGMFLYTGWLTENNVSV
jgi:Phosphatidylinositol-4-phosphate 5-kinase